MTFDDLVNLVSSDNAPSICVDSRLVSQGDIFVAVGGTVCDGHDFIDQAVANGAEYVVHQQNRGQTTEDRRQKKYENVFVEDPAKAAAILAQAAKGNPAAQLTNLAVTGTNGKTTVAFLVRSVIQEAGQKCGLIGTVIYDTCSGGSTQAALTTPDCLAIAQMTAEIVENSAKYMVIEASSHALSQNRLAGLNFKAAAFTNLAGDHLDYHKTEADYLAAKTQLFKALRPDATAVLNKQSPHAKVIAAQTSAGILWYGVDPAPIAAGQRTAGGPDAATSENWCGADITAHIESMDISGTTFVLKYAGQKQKVATPLLGRYNLSNSLAAAGLCLAAGFDLEAVARGLSALQVIPGRLEKLDWPGDFTVLIDYAHTDDALKNVLATLKPLCKGRAPGPRLIVVFGCGGDRDRTKRPRMARVAEQLADFLVVTSDNPRTERPEDIISEIVAGFENPPQADATLPSSEAKGRNTQYAIRNTIIVEPDRKKAIRIAIETADKNDIVLIAGKGHETYQVIGTQKFKFSDKEVAQELLLKELRTTN